MLNNSKLHVTHLHNIAAIRTGYTVLQKLRGVSGGNTSLIQMKDVSQDGFLQPAALTQMQIVLLPSEHLLCPGDLIFRSRGDDNTTALIDVAVERAVCVAPLLLLRILPTAQVLPAYLHWFMNLSTTRRHINNYPRETTTRMIAPALLADVKVVVPTLARQRRILEIAQLNQQMLATATQIAEIRHLETETILLQYAEGAALPTPAAPLKG
jgi:hypothetical protein